VSLDEGFIIPSRLPLVYRIEFVETDVFSPSGLEGRSGGIIEAMFV